MTAEVAWRSLRLDSMQAAWDASPTLIVLTLGPEHLVAYQNPASRRLFGPRPLGVEIGSAFPELSPSARATLDEVLRGGVAVVEGRPRPGVLGVQGEEVLLTYVFAAVGDPNRPAAGVLLTAIDVTAEAHASRASAQAAILSELSDRMNAAEDPNSALRELTRTLVPALADLAAVFVVPGADEPDRLRSTELNPRRGRANRAVAMSVSAILMDKVGRPPENAREEQPSPWQQSLAAGQPLLIDIAGGDLEGRSDAAVSAWLNDADARNMAVLPLSVAGELSGAVVLLSVSPRPPYEVGDLRFLELAATRAGSAVGHLRLFRRQRQITLDLQHALLPEVPSAIPNLDVAVRYLAGSADVEIGGDWWDIQYLGDGHTGIGLGDVAGKGIGAAVVMGQARSAMRAASLAGLSPARVLALLDQQLAGLLDSPVRLGTEPPPTFATAVYAVLDTVNEELRVANAGHPPLLVRLPDGTVSRVQAPPGLPLGLGGAGFDELDVPFPTGSLVLGFTDGLVETRSEGIEAGLRSVENFLVLSSAECDVEKIAEGVLHAVRRGHGLDDDVALIVIRSSG
ncbi:MAG: SpoIIE family protein phosphatase [Actinomycetota bacterium]|nr:SpoIIE family protein phosphatase [Actinomycetota bacterium]